MHINSNKTKIKVIVTDFIEPDLKWEEDELAPLGIEIRAYQLKHAPPEELVEKLKDGDVLIVNMARMTKEVMSNLPNCKLIVRHGVGYDNIDLNAASELGIQVSYVPDYCVDEVAEQAVMLMLGVWRRIRYQLRSMGQSVGKAEWDFSSVGTIRRIAGRRAGIIGCGRIGSRTLRIVRGFGMEATVCDPYLSEKRQKELGITVTTLEEVLQSADFISLHCILNESTYHLIGEKQLRMMKSNAILVNTARGGLVDIDALARACREGWIAGAGIDVFEEEPPDSHFPLLGLDNVLLTPHLSWYSEDAVWEIRKKIIEDIKRFVSGQGPRFPLNKVIVNG